MGEPAPRAEDGAAAAARHAELLSACAAGTPDAFERLVASWGDHVYALALHFTGDSATAADVTQDVFLKLLARAGQFRGESRFSTWLYRIVANTVLDGRRSARRVVALEEAPALSLVSLRDTPEEEAARQQTARRVRAAVRRLPPKLRLAVVLRHSAGLSYDEMAAVLGVPTGTVASRLARAYRRLAGDFPERAA